MAMTNPDSGDRERCRLGGVHGVAVLNAFWGLIVPLSAALLYGWMRFSSASIVALSIHGMDWVVWTVPPLGLLLAVTAIVGLYMRRKFARRLSLVLASSAVVVFAVYLVAAFAAPEHFSPVVSLVAIALYVWQIWYLRRPHVRKAFEK